MKIEECYFCGSKENEFYASENGYNLVKCQKCSLIFVENRPDEGEIKEAHKQGIHKGDETINVTGEFLSSKVDWYLKVLNDLYGSEKLQGGKWLDIGCGHGEFIAALNIWNEYFDVTGSEPNVKKQESAKSRGLNVDFIDLKRHDVTYDVISILNVYSHLPNPPEFFARIKNNLAKGGELILETGDSSHLSAKDHYRPFYLPDHLSFASEDIVVGILKNLGFKIIEIKKYPYLKFNSYKFFKELLKAVIPNYDSKMKYYFYKKYKSTDMFVRAKLIK
jgi:SAM-dependent methyltransferase